jgi:hypothetical protein
MDSAVNRRFGCFEKLAFATLLASGLAAVLACGGGPPRGAIPADLVHYPPSPAFDEVIETHVKAGTDNERRIVLTTWFLNGDPRVGQFCSVREDGTCVEYQFVSDVRSLQSRKTIVPADTLTLLKGTLREMPRSVRPPLENVLIVSFRDPAGVWQTRVYDRTARPEAVSTIFGLTNAPIVP